MGSFSLGSIFGFPIRVKYGALFWLLIGLMQLGGLGGAAFVAIIFSFVLLHELGHALMARRLGVGIKDIQLGFMGGAARMMGLPKSADGEIAIAAAGPAVSFGLAGLLGVVGVMAQSPLMMVLAKANLVIAAFNLLPALPMDGGRILRAWLSKRMGFLQATEKSAKVARIFALVFAVAAFTGIPGVMAPNPMLIVISVAVFIMSYMELNAARFRAWASSSPYADMFGPDMRSGYGNDAGWPGARSGGFGRGPVYDVSDDAPPAPTYSSSDSSDSIETEYLPPAKRGSGSNRGGGPTGHFRVRVVRW